MLAYTLYNINTIVNYSSLLLLLSSSSTLLLWSRFDHREGLEGDGRSGLRGACHPRSGSKCILHLLHLLPAQ